MNSDPYQRVHILSATHEQSKNGQRHTHATVTVYSTLLPCWALMLSPVGSEVRTAAGFPGAIRSSAGPGHDIDRDLIRQ